MSVAVRFTDVLPPPPREGWPGPISFDVPEGLWLLAATTPAVASNLIRLAAGLREPAAGAIEVLGLRPGALNRWETQRFRRRLGVGFDEPSGIVSNLTLRMNLVVPMLYSGLTNLEEGHRRAAALLDRFGHGRWADLRPADVPPEVRREAVVARAIVREPQLLVLEEPIATLSDRRARWVLSVCREMAGTAVMTTTEAEGVQFEFADIVVAIDDSGFDIKHHEVGVG